MKPTPASNLLSSAKRLRRSVALATVIALCQSLAHAQAEAADRPPNVLMILADDLGWRDTSAYGSTYYHTPHIDRLIARGVRFTHAYTASPLCSPTRASILTGLHPARIGLTAPRAHYPGVVLKQSLLPGKSDAPWREANSVTRLDTAYVTLPEVLQSQGYRTGHFGKWHLGRPPYSPLEQGYDEDIPHWHGPGPGGHYLAPWDKFGPEQTIDQGQPGEHIEDRMADETIRFMAETAETDRPFFAAYWAFSVHSPWDQHRDVKPDLLDKYKNLIDPDSPQRHPVMGGMIETFDTNVGRLIDFLDEAGLAENTVVIFFSDNGGVHWEPPAKYGWSDRPMTSNAPLRGGKTTIYEGGVRVPLAVVWPAQISPSQTTDAAVSSIDLFPTLLTMLGIEPPSELAFDGRDFSPALSGRPIDPRPQFVHFPHGPGYRPGWQPSTSVVFGDYKLIRLYAANTDQTDRYELYDLTSDVGETRDLTENKPELFAQYKALIDHFLADTQAIIPTANPDYLGPGKKPEPVTLGGWTVRKHAFAELNSDGLSLNCVGSDPYLVASEVPTMREAATLRVRLKSAAGNTAEIHWQEEGATNFSRDSRVEIDIPNDNQWHVVSADITLNRPLTALRLDPSTAPGQIQIGRIELVDASGKTVRSWSFDDKNE